MLSENNLEVVTALNALSKLISVSIIDALKEQILKLVGHSNELIRKKSIMILHKIYLLEPSAVSDFHEKLKKSLYDKDPSVMGAAVSLYLEVFQQAKQNNDLPRIK